jgi:hypothetical protein
VFIVEELKKQVLADAEERKRQFRQELSTASIQADTDTLYTRFCNRVDAQAAETIQAAEEIGALREAFRAMIAAVAEATAAGDTDKAKALFAAFAEKHGL